MFEAKAIKILVLYGLPVEKYYLHASYAILYPKGMGSGIQNIDKTNEFLSVMTV